MFNEEICEGYFSGGRGLEVVSLLFDVLDEFFEIMMSREEEFCSVSEVWEIYDGLANIIDDFSFELESQGFFFLNSKVFSIFSEMEKLGFDVYSKFQMSPNFLDCL